ncbi:MAG: hypothetical protein HZA65_01655 [Rhodocyclales bacterium]|nr:hypothetical protein [Rhodocyclales bacterium]
MGERRRQPRPHPYPGDRRPVVRLASLEIDGHLTVAEGHEIAKRAVATVKARHPVLHLTTHVDPL